MNTITTVDLICERAKTLPKEQAQEVLDFPEYLQAKLKKWLPPLRKHQTKKKNPCPVSVCGQTVRI